MKRVAFFMFLLITALTSNGQDLRFAADYAGFRSFLPDLLALQKGASGQSGEITLVSSSQAYRQVADGTVDFTAVGRGPLDGDVYEAIAVSLPVAWDAIAIITHPDNPVDNLSLTQLRDIYAGKITNWRTLGGTNRPIRTIYLKDKNESPQYLLSRFLFGTPGHTMHGEAVETAQMAESIAESNPNALAFTFYSSARERQVKLLGINGLKPAYGTILSGQYPFYTEVYLLTRPGIDRKRNGRALIKQTGSVNFRRVLRRIGIVPYTSASELIAHRAVRDAFLARELGY